MIDLGKVRTGFGTRAIDLSPAAEAALRDWQAMPEIEEGKAHYFVRYVSLDVATTGLDPAVDKITSLAAIAISQGAVSPQDVCAYDFPVGEPTAVAVADNLAALLTYLGREPLVTFQAAFVDAFLRRSFEEHLGLDFSPPWIDLAWVLPELFGQIVAGAATLDDWLHHFNIRIPGRREALSDAVAVARLLLAAQNEATRCGIDTPKKLREIEHTRRWLGRT